MEFLSAFSGLERIAIIAGAIFIGYWGFRLFATDRIPGLVFMGVACAVLIAVLVTGDEHVASLRSSLQPVGETIGEPVGESVSKPEAAPESVASLPPAAPEATALPPPEATKAITESADDGSPTALDATATAESEPEDILGGRDLDGRIISVKSENLTLEWAPPSE